MIDPAPSAPVVLHPAAIGEDPKQPEAPDRSGETKNSPGGARSFLSTLAGLWRRLPSIEDARKAFAQALSIDPRRSDAQMELAKIHMGRRELDTAISYARAASVSRGIDSCHSTWES